MENELAFYIAQGIIPAGKSVMDGRYEFYRNGRPVGLSSDDYRRLYFLDLLGASASDTRSTSDLEAAWFALQGYGRAEGFAKAYLGQASLGGEPLTPLVTQVTTDGGGLGNVTYDVTPVSATVALPNPATVNLVVGDELLIAIRSQNGTGPDPFAIAESHLSINNYASTRQLSLVAPKAPIVPVNPTAGPATITVTRTLNTGRTLYAPLFVRNVNLNMVDYALAGNSGPIDWSKAVVANSDETLLVLVLGWEATATNTPVYGPSAGVMQGATLAAQGVSSTDTGVSRTCIAVYTKVVPKGSYLMANGDVTVMSGTGVGSGITGSIFAIGPKTVAEPKVATWLSKNKRNKIMAHRGGSAPFPEHSEYAYQNAVGLGFICVEISMHRTTDGVWVANHDRWLDRTALGTETTTLDITAMTWADVQAHAIAFANGRVPQPITSVQNLIDKFEKQAVFMVDPKNSSAFLSEWLDMLDANGGPEKFICKFSGPGAALTHRATAAARGYKVWGYYFEGEDFTNAGLYDIVGLNNSASQAAWDELIAKGKPVLGHVIQNQAAYDEALAKGAQGFQIAATTTIYPE